MIKKWYDITVGEYKLMELTGKVDQYKRWYNPFPTPLFYKQIKKQASTLLDFIHDNRNSDLEEHIKMQEHKYLAKLQIEVNRLQGVEQLLELQLKNHARLLSMKNQIRSRKLRKIIDVPDVLRYAIREAEELTGIKIVEFKDIDDFKRVVKHRTDKLNEFINKQNDKNKTDNSKKELLGSLVNGIMMYLELSPVGVDGMKVIDFMDFYKKAIAKMKAEKEMYEKNKK